MVDPTIYYGWRDFSSRSSFGNLREWLHTSWLYDSNKSNYLEGMKRFHLLEINLDPYIEDRYINEHWSHNKLSNDVREKFYNFDSEWFLKIAKNFEIDYVVFVKSRIQRDYQFKLVYSNDSFCIYKIR